MTTSKKTTITGKGRGGSAIEDEAQTAVIVPFPTSEAHEQDGGLGQDINKKQKIKAKNKKHRSGSAAKPGRPRTHGLSGTPTYRSLASAKDRCTNPNHAQYQDYGGRGIEFHLTVEQLVDEIGIRPPGTSLDRINPNGHYEPGNVRWATPREQARNRRPPGRRRGSGRKIGDGHQSWVENARFWTLSIRRVNDGPLSSSETAELRRLTGGADVPRASFELDRPFDPKVPSSGSVELPSLREPGGSITLRVEPGPELPKLRFGNCGVLRGLVHTPARRNVSEPEAKVMNQFLDSCGAGPTVGLCFMTTQQDAAQSDTWPTPPEVPLMAFAAHLLARGECAFFMPMADVSARLALDHWGDLEARFLVVPDLHVKGPKGFGIESWRVSELRDLLEMRARERLPTVICADDPWALNPEIGELIHRRYMIVGPGDAQAP